jgi:hypothetical protein
MRLKILFFSITNILIVTSVFAQNNMTPELLWKLGRVNSLGISRDGKNVLYNVTTYNAQKTNQM